MLKSVSSSISQHIHRRICFIALGQVGWGLLMTSLRDDICRHRAAKKTEARNGVKMTLQTLYTFLFLSPKNIPWILMCRCDGIGILQWCPRACGLRVCLHFFYINVDCAHWWIWRVLCSSLQWCKSMEGHLCHPTFNWNFSHWIDLLSISGMGNWHGWTTVLNCNITIHQ